MNSAAQLETDWTATQPARGADGSAVSSGGSGVGDGAGAYLSDEEILGIDTPASSRLPDAADSGDARALQDGESARGIEKNSGSDPLRSIKAGDPGSGNSTAASDAMPPWMQTLAGDPQHGSEAQQLWQDHQAFRAAFSSPQEAREIKELFPGGVQDARILRQASQAVDQLDAAIYSGDARAQSQVVAELARTNPSAFRSLFAEAAKVLAGLGGEVASPASKDPGSEDPGYSNPSSPKDGFDAQVSGTNHPFNPAAYASFERSTNDFVARDVRAAVADTLTRVLPEGVAEGAARRIGDDIFNEIHRTLAADRTLSEQVGEVLRDRRFGATEQQRVASLLAGRARQIVPGVARRVIGEWTSSVLGATRSKAARQAAAASRVDIAAPGGSRDSAPLRPMSPREVNYASMSDDEILGM